MGPRRSGSLSTPVTIVRTARTLDNPTAEPLPQEPTTSAVVSSATDDVKSPPPRKRSRFSTELMGERRQSSRVKDKSKPDAPQQDARLASLASFFRQWSSSAQQSYVLLPPPPPPHEKCHSAREPHLFPQHAHAPRIVTAVFKNSGRWQQQMFSRLPERPRHATNRRTCGHLLNGGEAKKQMR